VDVVCDDQLPIDKPLLALEPAREKGVGGWLTSGRKTKIFNSSQAQA